MAQKERENFYRNSTVIVDHGKESLSAVLDNELSNTNMTFEDFINKHQHDIYHLCYNKNPCCKCPGGRFVPTTQSRIIHPDQLDILLDKCGPTLHGHNPNIARKSQHCCRPAKSSLSYTNLDITILRCLLINFAKNCQTNSILRQDIEDLVKCRNKLYGHVQEARVTDTDYTKYKTDVEGIILRIARFCNIENEMQQKLNDVSQRPLDETILIQYQNTLMQQSLYDRNIEEKVDKLQQHLTAQDERLDCRMGIIEGQVSEVDYRKRNIIAQTEAYLSEHSKDDTYVITEDVKLCCDILDRYKTLVIIAKAGGGKSKISLQIAMMYQEKLYTPMLFINDEVLRKREFIDFNENNIVIVEDLFGRSNIDFNEDQHRGILDVLFSCIKRESCKSKLIFTIRGNDKIKHKLVEKHTIFEKNSFINLDKELSWHSKNINLLKHMNKHGISLCDCIQFGTWSQTLPSLVVKRCLKDVFETKDNSMKVCVSFFHNICQGNYEIQIGFPQACHLFCSNKNLTKQGMAYFRHTSQSLVNEMNHFKIQGFDNKQIQYQFCVLVYTAMKNSINFHDIDEKCFQNVLSCLYGESHQVKMSLLKAAVLMLEGKYISRKSASSTSEQCKRPTISNHYVLQHYTIQEAVLISYGEDADVLTFCDFCFLQEYIRPKGYIDELSDSMVLSFIDYKPLVKRLISMLSIDDNTCTGVGRYLKVVALMHRRDEIIQFFFQNIKDVKPEQYTRLVNGLTNFGKNGALVDFHPQLCREVMRHAGLNVFLAFCRPIGWVDNDTYFVEMETDFLIKTLIKFFNRLDENGQESKENISEYFRRFSFLKLGLGNYLYAVGDYVFKKLMEKGFVHIVELFLTNLKQNIWQISPLDIKDFLDGLLNEGKRSSIVSQFKDFFEAVLFKYGSIPAILLLCRPLTSSISSQNIIKVDDKFLAGKLSAYFESSSGIACGFQMSTPVVLRENGTYYVFWDYNYLEMKFINDIAQYISKHGFNSNNDNFVRMMYEQFVSYENEQITDEDSNDDDDPENSTDEVTNQDDAADNCAVNDKKVVFDDYPGDEFRVNANGMVIGSQVIIGSVKKVYGDTLDFNYRTTYSRLFKFLSYFEFRSILPWRTPGTLMGLLKMKFESLLDAIDPERSSSGSDCCDYSDDSDYEFGY